MIALIGIILILGAIVLWINALGNYDKGEHEKWLKEHPEWDIW